LTDGWRCDLETPARRWRPVVALALVGAVLLFFWGSPLLWPVKIVVVLFHELGHATAAWATGGEVAEIGLSAREGGHTLTRGGIHLVILNAGYLGSLLAGVGLLAATRNPRAARITAWVLPALLLVTAVLLVRPILGFGMLFTALVAAAFAGMARYGSTELVRWVLRALGVFSVLYAVFDVRSDVFLGDGGSDAHMLAEATMVPAFVWGAGWILAGCGILWLTRKWIA
jgi:hypothetical protein